LKDDDKLNVTLINKVRALKVKTSYIQNKSSDSVAYFFDERGIIEKCTYVGLGLDARERKLRDEEVHYIFKEGHLVSKLNKLYDGLDGNVYQYDKKWNLVSYKNYMNDILIKEIICNYDKMNNLTDKTEYLFGGFSGYNDITQEGKLNYLYEIEKYEYDDNNMVIVKRTYNFRENKTMRKTQYKYDGMKNLIEEGSCISYGEADCEYKPTFGFEYNFRNMITRKYDLAKFSPHNTDEYFQYDNIGNKVEVKGMYIYPDKEPVLGFHFAYKYDKFGSKTLDEEVVGKYRRISNERYKTERLTYDLNQNLVLQEYLNADGTTIKVVRKIYTYDSKKNWIKRETEVGLNINDLTSTEISTRVIEYY
jgi:hypothetical protein